MTHRVILELTGVGCCGLAWPSLGLGRASGAEEARLRMSLGSAGRMFGLSPPE